MAISFHVGCLPIVMASSGPKSLQLAGRIADGVLFQVGADPHLVQYALANLGIDGFVSPFGMPEPIPYMETFAEQVIPRVIDREASEKQVASG